MARVDKPRYGVRYWKSGEAKTTVWLANEEAQDRKVRDLKNKGYQTRKVNR